MTLRASISPGSSKKRGVGNSARHVFHLPYAHRCVGLLIGGRSMHGRLTFLLGWGKLIVEVCIRNLPWRRK
ncbi:hypothetical protein D3C72_487160 [compost metagenome]